MVADAAVHTTRLVNGTAVFFGAVQMIDDEDADNEPHHLFTRDGLHPNTPLQILIARSIIKAFNTGYGAGIRQINDAEALRVLGISPREPYIEWVAPFNVAKSGPLKDGEGDGLTNLVEYAFGLNPAINDAASLPATRGGPVEGVTGDVSVTFTPDPVRDLHTDVFVQYSVNGTKWKRVPADHVIENGDGSVTAVVPPQAGAAVQTRVKVLLLPPPGSKVTIASVVPVN